MHKRTAQLGSAIASARRRDEFAVPQETAALNSNDQAWGSIEVNPATLFVGNTESGFMGLEVRSRSAHSLPRPGEMCSTDGGALLDVRRQPAA